MSLSPSEAIVLAGGAGTRLRSAVPDVPKVLAPVRGRPFLDRLLEWMTAGGIESIVLATGFGADAVETAARTWSLASNISFSRETDPLGTGGAIAHAFRLVHGNRAWAFNGDSFCDVDLAAVASESTTAPDAAWLVATSVDDTSRFGTLELNGSRVSRFLEKRGRRERGLINAGIYLLPRALMPDGACSIERDLLPAWAADGRLRAVAVDARFIDIGTPESFAAADPFFA